MKYFDALMTIILSIVSVVGICALGTFVFWIVGTFLDIHDDIREIKTIIKGKK